MKKTFIYIAMAAAALSSCSKNEVYETATDGISDPNKISFNTTTGTTRAVSNDLAALQGSADGFNVLGIKNGGTNLIPGTDNAGTYKFTTPNWGWDGTSYNWPTADADYPVTFYAEYPKVDMSANTSLEKDITMETAIFNQIDYLIAKKEVDIKPNNGFTELQFKHILSNLVFKIETKDKYKVYIKSIRVVNTAYKGRTFDYATMAYKTEPNYSYPDDYASILTGEYNEAEGCFYFKGSTYEFTGDVNSDLIGTVETSDGSILMQMPQKTIPYWIESNNTDGLGKFKTDAAAWKAAGSDVDEWYTGTVGGNPAGMNSSDGWKGARIEMIYRIYDTDAGKSIIGRQTGETYTKADGNTDTAGKEYFIRVGYPLDLGTAPTADGWEMNKRYTYTIQMGTAKATNGILLDPDYKIADGSSDTPKVPVENPAVDPGNPTTPGTINFIVDVDNWVDNTGIDIN